MRWAVLALVLAALPPSPVVSQAPSVVQCRNCHAQRDRFTGRDSSKYVPADILAATAHAGIGCADCHQGYGDGYPHTAPGRVVGCETCHTDANRDWMGSVHAPNAVETGDAPRCVDCHGFHEVYSSADRRSPSHPLNVAATCGRCHADSRIIGSYFATPDKAQSRTAVSQYFETVHGHALTDAGLTVSATCNDCHESHRVLPGDSAASSVHRNNIPATCGRCHEGIVEVYDSSAHGSARRNGPLAADRQSPVCVDCHSAHGIVRASEPLWHLGAVEECGSCHAEVYRTYLDTYHGKVTRLGSTLAATCADCHTPHDMRAAEDPRSTVHGANLVETCRQCHPNASESFAAFQPHTDPADPSTGLLHLTWLFMTSLLIGVMAFFGLHTLLWVTRLVIDRIRTGRWHGVPEDGAPPTGGPA